MTVSTRIGINQRIWRGYDDPGLPVGMWMSSQTVLGDASGGNMTIIFVFREEGNPVTGRFYNIEQMNIMRTAGGITGSMKTVNFESVGPTGLANFEYQVILVNNVNGTFKFVWDQASGPRLPLFLGSAQALATLSAQLEIAFNNTLNATVAVQLQGYIWEARSVMAEGGLRRPVDSLYGQ